MKKTYYWDSSAILSLLVEDIHSKRAHGYYNNNEVNLISSLVIAEVFAVLARIERENTNLKSSINEARETFKLGNFRTINLVPDIDNLKKYSQRYSLRGADLWHLCLVLSIKEELPNIKIISFDKKLSIVADDLHLSLPI